METATARLKASVRARRQPSRAKLRLRLHASLLALDVLCILFGFFLAHLLYPPINRGNHWLMIAAVMTPIYLGAAFNARAYATRVIAEPSLGVTRAVQAFVIAAATVVLVAFYLKASASFSRVGMVLGSTFSIATVAVARQMFLRKAHAIVGGNPYSTVLITDLSFGVDQGQFSFVITTDEVFHAHADTLDMYDRLSAILTDSDRVVVACAPHNRLKWVHVLKGAGIHSEIITPELAQYAPLGIGYCDGTPSLIVAEGPLSRFDLAVKRAFDIAVSGAALIVLAPVMIATAIAIRIDSKGPIFFVQPRIGHGNRMFRMLKFRSMRVEASDGAGRRSTARGDSRVTRIGAFIRRTSIDELPQLFNVLVGDMSIVGPRPHAVESRAEEKLFWEIDERYWHRHAAKPGLTGLAQVRGYRGATLQEQDLTNRLQADLEYLQDWSIWRDAAILLKTFRVLIHKNAF